MRTRWFVVGAAILQAAWPGIALSQDCSALVNHGIRNVEIEKSSSAAVATKYYRNCGLDFEHLEDAVLGNVEIEVFGYGSGSGGLNKQQRSDRLKQWCVTNREFAQSAQSQYVESQTIMAEALAAWSRCNELVAKGVRTEPRISGDQRIVDLSVSNTSPSPVIFYGVTPTNFTCDTKVPGKTDAQVKAALTAGTLSVGPAAISVHCERRVVSKVLNGQTYAWLEAATLSVRTASDPYQLFFPEETNPILPDKIAAQIATDVALLKRLSPPVGSIVGFILKPEEVSSLAPNWVPADGRTVNDPQSSLNGRVLPDMNGRLLRGLAPTADASDEASSSGGSSNVAVTADTAQGRYTSCSGGFSPQPTAGAGFNQGGFVIDTPVDEVACNHLHHMDFVLTLPAPPYRGVIYMVRVR